MSEIFERLAAADPAADEPYQHRDLDSLISRVLALPAATRPARWRRARYRLGGGAVLAGGVSVGLVALLGGGAALPALAIASVNSTRSPTATSTSEFAAAAASSHGDFRAGAALSASAPVALSYQVHVPAPAAVMSRLARVFQVNGTPTHTRAEWSLDSSSGASLNYQLGGVPQWYYSSTTYPVAPATKSDHASVPMPSHPTLVRDVHQDLAALGFNYELSSPLFSTSTVSIVTAAGADEEQSQEQVIYQVVAGRTEIGQSVMFQIDARNRVLYAQGPALVVGGSRNYPLASPRAAVRSLNEIAPTPGPRRAITLRSVHVSLREFTLRNGARWLLPVYTYGAASTATPAGRHWTVLAIQPTYAHLSAAAAKTLLANG
jgi:hypothetical protein